MANTVRSKNIIFKMEVSGVYYPVFCCKTFRLSDEQEELETTNITSGSDREYIPGMGNHLVEASGVTTSNNTNGRIAITYLQQQAVRRLIHNWKIEMTDDAGAQIFYTFRGMIRNTDFDKTLPGYSTSNVVIRVTGNVTITTVAPPVTGGFTVHADYWTAVATQNYISGASTGNTDGTSYTLLATDTILAVEVEDMTMYEVSGTPTNGEPEYKWNTSTVRVEFSAARIFDGGERVFVMFKRPV